MINKLYPKNPILLVDDETMALSSYELSLHTCGINNVISCKDSRHAMSILERQDIDLVVLDLMMPHVTGQDLLGSIRDLFPHIPVIIASGKDDVDVAIECMKVGAVDYLNKPINCDELIERVKRAVENKEFATEGNDELSLSSLMHEQQDGYNSEIFKDIITRNGQMLGLFKYVEAVAKYDKPVLITGETGVGKELFAQAIHRASGRTGEFVAVNAAGLEDNMFADTLFGHCKGAFTGAISDRRGVIEKAQNGTLFLDEIGDLSLASQVKILRLLQEYEFSPLGSDENKKSNARIVLATHRNLHDLQVSNKFRKDLYYRIATHHIHIPALRERSEDIILLMDYFLDKIINSMNKEVDGYHCDLLPMLKKYHFPGNVRELEAMMYDAISNTESRLLQPNVFQNHIKRNLSKERSLQVTGQFERGDEIRSCSFTSNIFEDDIATVLSKLNKLPNQKEMMKALTQEALNRTNNNQRAAAKILGISPQALNARLKGSN
ncbi:sigma-54 dependent transcriptional regulator [Lentisphaerota bacterium WC36G]|nr:sigma-54 dependent transcriptional regulator [Lentisphaerae bacterium WC36]